MLDESYKSTWKSNVQSLPEFPAGFKKCKMTNVISLQERKKEAKRKASCYYLEA